MSRQRLGLALCVLGFIAVCVGALVSTANSPFAGLPGIENGLEEDVADLLFDDDAFAGLAASDPEAVRAAVSAEGRQLTVQLPATVPSTFDRVALQSKLSDINGVRSVRLVGNPAIAVPADDAPAPQPTAVPESESTDSDPTDDEPDATDVDPEPTVAPESEPDMPLPLAIAFEPGTAVLTIPDRVLLDMIAEQLQGQTSTPIQVQAHTDNLGDPDVNLLLSQDRAQAVTDYLIERGVDPAVLTPRGYGASMPIADNSTEQGRAENHRVVFVVEGN